MNDEQREINEERLSRLKRLSEKLDDSITIPGTERKIGIDPIIGLIPVGGDLIGGVISLYIMRSGIKMGVPRETIIRMFVNVVLEFLIGCLPIVGDLFDATWKSNQRNVKLIENSVMADDENTIFGFFLIGILISVLVGVIILALTLMT